MRQKMENQDKRRGAKEHSGPPLCNTTLLAKLPFSPCFSHIQYIKLLFFLI